MAEPITAIYVQEDDDWTVTVAGGGRTLTGRAPGIIAARDSVDQLVEELGAEAKGATVVHLLNGSALEFTAAYMSARLTLPETAPLEIPESAPAAQVPAQPQDDQEKPKVTRAAKAKLTTDIGDALTKPKPRRTAAAGR
ncbi:hypothetical protein ORV05_03490 [Amycolatopsis cynarae]|uniref:DUF2188 domain-containing protein n=1 Tax=Amycolatopsis cynarae TaxID=2995223 RepID=A0ABY7B6R7_9PSEU|nr:hypothetical protein [Amycolatopsis sp. HUAS 11-8]WAL66883.1 hypothetical protein ORV05_03490 [Amycolatopsis sp. HUAS 11-8]